ncbi:hypothetical protein CXK94_22050 [Stutzerimonas stutzeri]|jgi:type I restriction enzyme M protein|uniref:site-specific DNA-methyltransferase (adenine-specific) n=1 Tax=Stutzerimonas stutzeri TaxID=316 RepID=A0A2N8SPR7_STUST|nr:N-6 DNA methylase [Stutzerimonas stutzeri]MCQ4327582.1 SAM-dependent methyltransferase [Stutzerimonas stutzeri]PNG04488.1 hypothetical protein CXK94_22050 [Stutzerimonas stutzeri]
MSKESLLMQITSYPNYRKLAPHLFLLIVGGEPEHEERAKDEEAFFGEIFFEQMLWRVRETSHFLADILGKKLGIYKLEHGDLSAHQELFRSLSRVLAEDDSQRPALLEALIQVLEDTASYKGDRPCPRELIQVISGLCPGVAGSSFYDPHSSTGRLLAELVSSTPSAWGLGQSACDEGVLYGLLRAFFKEGTLRFEQADALKSPPCNHTRLQVYDVVVSDLSGGVDTWDPELGAMDPFGRFKFGTASKGRGEWPFIQHMLACMHPDHGIAIAVVDLAALTRTGKESEIRGTIIASGLLDSVIYLPPKLYRSDVRPLALLVFRPSREDRPVLLIDGSKQYTSEKSLNTLTPACIQQIREHYSRREPVDGATVLANADDLERNGYVLNPGRYFSSRPAEEGHDLDALRREHASLRDRLREVTAEIDDLLSEFSEG